MPATYEPIATTTLGSAASSITFSSIPGTYTDLVLIFAGKGNSSNDDLRLQFNGDTGTNYSRTDLYGDGTSAASARGTGGADIRIAASDGLDTNMAFLKVDIFSYAGSTNKTCLVSWSHDKNGSGYVYNQVGLWRNTSAITSVRLSLNTQFAANTTATLYGILKA